MKPLWNVLSIPPGSSFLVSPGVCNIPARLNSLKCPKHTIFSLCIKICFIHIAPSVHYAPYIFLPRWCVINFQSNSNSTLYFLYLYFPAGGFLPGTAGGLLLNLERNCLRRCTYKKAKDFFGMGNQGRQQQGKEAQNCLTMWLEVSGFTMVGLAFWLSSGQSSCLCLHVVGFNSHPGDVPSLGQDGF